MVRKSRMVVMLAGATALGATLVVAAADAPPAPAAPAPAAAAPAAPPPTLVSGATAQMLAETCAGCHGTDGLSAGPASPILAASNAEYFIESMKGFQDGKVYSTVMGRIAKGYTEDEIKLMAEYFQAKPFKGAKQTFDAKLAEKGAKLHDKFCEKCHSEGGKPLTGEAATAKAKGKEADKDDEDAEGGDEEYQILAGQWTAYLAYAMEDFKEGRREIPKKMKTKLKDLEAKNGEAGLQALFAFYASQK